MFEAGKTQETIDAEKAQAVHDSIIQNRAQAYKIESDPLYMEWQFDQTEESEQIWRDKVKEIKERYPK